MKWKKKHQREYSSADLSWKLNGTSARWSCNTSLFPSMKLGAQKRRLENFHKDLLPRYHFSHARAKRLQSLQQRQIIGRMPFELCLAWAWDGVEQTTLKASTRQGLHYSRLQRDLAGQIRPHCKRGKDNWDNWKLEERGIEIRCWVLESNNLNSDLCRLLLSINEG